MLNFTIGPVMSDNGVLEIASVSTPYFRTPEFSSLMKENEKLMLEFLNAPVSSRCVFLTASGTGGMESAVMNVLNDEDKVVVINGGSFGQRFVDLCKLHKLNYTEIKLNFGESLKPEHLSNIDDSYTAFVVNMHETSSGVLYDMEMISEFCKTNNIFLLVDAISAFIADKIDMEKLNAGVVITGSQKALAVQPGVVVMALSPQALSRIEKNREQCLYLSLKEALINGERGQTPFTPAVTTLLQIHQRLTDISLNGGIEQEQKLIEKRANFIREKLKGFPFEIVAETPSNAVTAYYTDNNAAEIVKTMKDEYNIWICPNGGEHAKDVFRIGHIGNITQEDNETLINAFIDMKSRGLI